MKTTTKLRILLKEASAKVILEQLWANKDKKDILVHLAVTENCINDSVSLNQSRQWLPENLLEECHNKFDGPFFIELRNVKVINKFSFGEGDLPNRPPDENSQVAQVSGLNPTSLKYLIDWISELPFIKDHGDFSLNTLSGIACFGDKETKIYKNSSYFKLLKSFLEQENFSLSVEDILQISGHGIKNGIRSNENYGDAIYVLKNLGRRIGIRKGLNRVFSYTGNLFVLTG